MIPETTAPCHKIYYLIARHIICIFANIKCSRYRNFSWIKVLMAGATNATTTYPIKSLTKVLKDHK